MFNFFDTMLDARIAEVSEFTPEQAEAVEFGATTVIGILSNASGTFDQTPEVEAGIIALFDAAQPSIDRLREATLAAQVAEVEVNEGEDSYDEWDEDDEDDEDEDYEVESEGPSEADALKVIDDMLEGLFAAFIGPEAAAAVRAEVEADDRRKAAETEVEVEPEDEFDKFLRDLLGMNA